MTPHIIAELRSARPRWLFVSRRADGVETLHSLGEAVVEELCVLGALLLFGEGPKGLFAALTLQNECSGEIYSVSVVYGSIVLPS